MLQDFKWLNHILNEMKRTSKGRRPLKEATSQGRRPLKEDDLKLLKVEYLSNHLLNHSQIFNLSLDDQAIFYKSLKWRQPLMEDDLKY